MPLPEHLPTLLAEVTAAGTDTTKTVTVTGGPVRLRLRGTDGPILTTLLSRLVPALQPASAAVDGDVHDIRVVSGPRLAQRLDQAITLTSPAGEIGEPHRVRDGVHLVRKQAGAPSQRRAGYLLRLHGVL